jgi:hypothetical protein
MGEFLIISKNTCPLIHGFRGVKVNSIIAYNKYIMETKEVVKQSVANNKQQQQESLFPSLN